ncbi:AMP-dependent synthetase/ligase [Tanacetum coccineum]|uniref:AMP-dependent synthetase/ligase n=1 Tax=Tanacetum coccineum TaxID=301880 RepID=A0ABQ5APM3_9ASTR
MMSDSSGGGLSDLDDIHDLEMIMQQVQAEQEQEEEVERVRHRNYIYRERLDAEERLMADYLGPNPKYPKYYFWKRYRMSHKLFLEIVLGFSVIMKCTCAIGQLAYGVTPDSLDEYLQMALIVCTGNEEIAQKHDMGNLLEVIKTGANNDLTVLNNSPLFDDLLDGISPVAPFECNGTFEIGCYLAVDIYPQWSSFVKSLTFANSEKNALFKRKQESARNDVERAFGVLQGRVHLGDFSRIIVGFYSINGLKSGKVEVHDNAVVGSQSILLPGSVVNNDVILGVLLVAPIHSVIKRGGVYMVKSRYSHRIGVNGKGVLNIYDDIKGLPNHKIFHLGTRFKSYLEIFTPIPSLLSDVAGQDHMPVALKMKWKLLCS